MKQLGDLLIFLLLIAILAAVLIAVPALVDFDDYRHRGGGKSLVTYLATRPRELQD